MVSASNNSTNMKQQPATYPFAVCQYFITWNGLQSSITQHVQLRCAVWPRRQLKGSSACSLFARSSSLDPQPPQEVTSSSESTAMRFKFSLGPHSARGTNLVVATLCLLQERLCREAHLSTGTRQHCLLPCSRLQRKKAFVEIDASQVKRDLRGRDTETRPERDQIPTLPLFFSLTLSAVSS
jgi:hypothetical protein